MVEASIRVQKETRKTRTFIQWYKYKKSASKRHWHGKWGRKILSHTILVLLKSRRVIRMKCEMGCSRLLCNLRRHYWHLRLKNLPGMMVGVRHFQLPQWKSGHEAIVLVIHRVCKSNNQEWKSTMRMQKSCIWSVELVFNHSVNIHRLSVASRKSHWGRISQQKYRSQY